MEAEREADRDHKQFDTNTQKSRQEVEYAIEKFVRYELTPLGLMYRVRWYGYWPPHDTVEPSGNLPRNAGKRHWRRKESGGKYGARGGERQGGPGEVTEKCPKVYQDSKKESATRSKRWSGTTESRESSMKDADLHMVLPPAISVKPQPKVCFLKGRKHLL